VYKHLAQLVLVNVCSHEQEHDDSGRLYGLHGAADALALDLEDDYSDFYDPDGKIISILLPNYIFLCVY
jgi:hypothetical protein